MGVLRRGFSEELQSKQTFFFNPLSFFSSAQRRSSAGIKDPVRFRFCVSIGTATCGVVQEGRRTGVLIGVREKNGGLRGKRSSLEIGMNVCVKALELWRRSAWLQV